MATAVLTPEAAEQLEDLSAPMHGRVLKLLESLERWPAVSGVKALAGDLAGHFRLRTGDYRIQFHVAGDVSDRGKDRTPRQILRRLNYGRANDLVRRQALCGLATR